MGRELRRKDAKRNGKSLNKEVGTVDTKQLFRKYLIMFLGIVGFLVVIYFLLAIFVTKEIDFSGKTPVTDNSGEAASNVTNPILAKNIFRQKEEEYYVYFFDFSSSDGDIAKVVNANLSGVKVYRVNTADSLNTNYVGETGNAAATGLDDLKVVNPTIIKVSGDQISLYLDGKDAILSYFG